MLKLAFCLYKYSPFGGLERNFLRITKACLAAGHSVSVFTRAWQGSEVPDGVSLQIIPAKGMSNVAKNRVFCEALWQQFDSKQFDLVVGFNRIPSVDLYYCADSCHWVNLSKSGRLWQRFLPRQRFFLSQEAGVFAAHVKTHIMYLAETEKQHYQSVYQTAEARFHYLPPGIEQAKIRRPMAQSFQRNAFRQQLGLAEDNCMLLMVGSDFKRKGVVRAIQALASLPMSLKQKTHLFIVGKGKPAALQQLAQRLDIAAQVHFMGGRDDVPEFLFASDWLLHTAVIENTGNAIVEALIAGLPVITLSHCGYAFHVLRADAGYVVQSEPYQQASLDAILHQAVAEADRVQLSQNAWRYADETDLYSRPQVAVQIIEHCAANMARESLSAR